MMERAKGYDGEFVFGGNLGVKNSKTGKLNSQKQQDSRASYLCLCLNLLFPFITPLDEFEYVNVTSNTTQKYFCK